ncbi:MAG: hypothetical protein KBD00_00470 [Candidatus Peribacteraceae bacterium]|nr:hypothetical protein [Candidatus Peribacteraceae bacterium]
MSDFSKNERLGAMVKFQETAGKNDIIIGPLHDDRPTDPLRDPLRIRVVSYDVGKYDSWDKVREKMQSILKGNAIFPPEHCRFSNDMPQRTVYSGLITIAQYGSGSSYHKTEPMTVVSREKVIWIEEEGRQKEVKVKSPILVIQTRFAADIFKCIAQLSEPSA